MKVTININCTPAEARAFFGMPDVTPLHEAAMEKMRGYMESGMEAQEIETLMKMWMTGAATGIGELQKAFWGAMGQGVGQGEGNKS